MTKCTYFMTVIDGVLCCLECACDKQTRDAFQSSRLTGVRRRVAITQQTLWWETEVRMQITKQESR